MQADLQRLVSGQRDGRIAALVMSRAERAADGSYQVKTSIERPSSPAAVWTTTEHAASHAELMAALRRQTYDIRIALGESTDAVGRSREGARASVTASPRALRLYMDAAAEYVVSPQAAAPRGGGPPQRAAAAEPLPAPTYGTPGILWASLTLALLTLPVVIVATEEGLARIPRALREASLALGATKAETLWRIVLPMAIPGIVCVTLFGFTLTWNEFTYALTFVSQTENKTAVVGVTADLIRGDIFYWGSLMAGAVVASLPIVVIYVWFLDYYVSGLTAGAVKG